ncbi:hypothetical protein L6452_01744 [Arctium lappa]|uniref:Uncharacterized protein n=1 Tax=Arctium lappa TaxID=4217 RepID=A0ACB9FGY6_ARCLA|nr:hypothetical protein L6452_01744 [Arctium lappa]
MHWSRPPPPNYARPPFPGVSNKAIPTMSPPTPPFYLTTILEEQNERVLSLLSKLPGATVPVDVEPRTRFQPSPFVDEIAMVDVPKKYNIPTFTPKYSGITDPTEHVA